MKRLAYALALLLCFSSLAAAQKTSIVFENFDLDSVTEIFCDTATFSTSPPKGMSQCSTGSADEDGWIRVSSEDFKGVAIHIDVMALTSGTIDVAIYGRVRAGSTPIELGTTRDYASAETQYVVVPEALRELRIGIVINGVDDGDAADEDVSIYYIGSRRLR
jgi:hypothetical protein